MPSDLTSCHQRIASQDKQLEELHHEVEKLRKLLNELLQGNRSERFVLDDPDQQRLPFETAEELAEARAEAEAEAEAIIQQYTVTRQIRNKKLRKEALPSHLPRVEKIIEVPDDLKNCLTHGERKVIGYDITETLMQEPARLWVQVTKYPKLVCDSEPNCGVVSLERPTSLVEGNRYDTSVATAVIENKWSLYLPIYRQRKSWGHPSGSGYCPT